MTKMRLFLRGWKYWFLMQASLYMEVLYWEKAARGERLRYLDATYFCLHVRKLSYLLDTKEYACTCCPVEWGWFNNGQKKVCFEFNTVYSKYERADNWQDTRMYARLVATAFKEAIPRWRREGVLKMLRKLNK